MNKMKFKIAPNEGTVVKSFERAVLLRLEWVSILVVESDGSLYLQ